MTTIANSTEKVSAIARTLLKALLASMCSGRGLGALTATRRLAETTQYASGPKQFMISNS